MNATERSIFGQFPFWEALPRFTERAVPGKRYAVVGCGTSFNLAQSITAFINMNGAEAIAVPGHEWTERSNAFTSRAVDVIVVSRSGESSEAVSAAVASTKFGYHVTAISCEPTSTLVSLADTALVAPTHREEGIVMTASASVMLLLGLQFAGFDLDCSRLIVDAQMPLRAVAELELNAVVERHHFVFLGGGALFGIAAEGALKVQEMSCTFTQVYHPLEYRHGPISLVDPSVAVIALYSEDDVEAEAKLTRELRTLGAIVVGFGGPGDISVPVSPSHIQRGAILLPALQLLGERLAQLKGLDTSQPRHLNKVVKIS